MQVRTGRLMRRAAGYAGVHRQMHREAGQACVYRGMGGGVCSGMVSVDKFIKCMIACEDMCACVRFCAQVLNDARHE